MPRAFNLRLQSGDAWASVSHCAKRAPALICRYGHPMACAIRFSFDAESKVSTWLIEQTDVQQDL